MKRIFPILLVMLLVIALAVLPVGAAQNEALADDGKRVAAAADALTFPTDGSDYSAVCPVHGKTVTWTPLTGDTISGGYTLPKGSAHYYLTDSVSNATVKITPYNSSSYTYCLHLNGKSLTNTAGMVFEGKASRLNIMGKGEIKGGLTGAEVGAAVGMGNVGSIHLYGGTYSKNNPSSTANVVAITWGGNINIYAGATIKIGTAGSAVYLKSNLGDSPTQFSMYGGTIDGTGGSEAAVELAAAVTPKGENSKTVFRPVFNMYGGTIQNGTCASGGNIVLNTDTQCNLYGGVITGGQASAGGGNISVAANAVLNLYGGTVQNGQANGSGTSSSGVGGGNIYVDTDGTMNMYGGTVTGGIAAGTGSKDGGGNIYLYKNAVLNMSGGTVSGTRDENGTATGAKAKRGGNVYLFTAAVMNMTGGIIENGTATNEGGNICASPVYTTKTADYAVLKLENATIRGGHTTAGGGSDGGGNLTLMRANATIGEGTQISNGVTGGKGGNIRCYIGTIVMTGGKISGGTANISSGYEEIWLAAGESKYPTVMYMLGGVIEGREQEYGSVRVNAYSSFYLGGDATVVDNNPENSDIYALADGRAKVYVCDGWSGRATVGFDLDTPISVGADVSTDFAQVVTLDAARNQTVGGSFSGELRYVNNGAHILSKEDANGTLVVGGVVLRDADGKETFFSDPMAAWETGAYSYMQLSGDYTIEDLGGKVLWIDLNGHQLTVGGDGTVHAFDSANDAYEAEKCGGITCTGTAFVTKDVDAPNGIRYIALEDAGKISMHRLDMKLTAISLRTSAAGIYYKAAYFCDTALAAKVNAYGIVLSVHNMPGADFLSEEEKADINCYTIGSVPFESGRVTTSGSVFGIMKDTREASDNDLYGKVEIYANPYIRLADSENTVLVSDNKNADKSVEDEAFDGAAYNLYDTMALLDDLYYNYPSGPRERMDQFLKQWQSKGMDWDFENINADRVHVDNSNLVFEEGTAKATCPVCKNTVTWTAITQENYGQDGIGATSNGAHYYLAENINYTGSDAAFIRAPSSGKVACLHLNGHDLTAANQRAIQAYPGVLNVMGNGTVSGNGATGCVIYANTTGGKVNLYGGTYTKPATNTVAMINVNAGGSVHVYEGAWIRGTGNSYTAYLGTGSTAAATLGFHGGKVTGGEVGATSVTTEKKARTVIIDGNAYVEEINIRDKDVVVNVSGAPVVDRLGLVSGAKLTVGKLTKGGSVAVSTSNVFTYPFENAKDYAAYFRAWNAPDSISVGEDNTLSYDINYEHYMTPYVQDVSAKAVADGKIHYYFMSGENMVMSPTNAGDIYKWGDCCLIAFPNGETMLVDSSYAIHAPVVIGNLKRMGVTKLDYLLISHPHNDHIGGAFSSSSAFLDEIAVGQVYYDAHQYPDNSWVGWIEKQCDARSIPYASLLQGDVLTFGEDSLAVTLTMLWPKTDLTDEDLAAEDAENNNSMVFRLDYGEHSSLFTADIYEETEAILVEQFAEELNVDLVKCPHHGWTSSNSASFINAISPEIAVATGAHEMNIRLWKRYNTAGATVLNDLYDGYVHIEAASDGTMSCETSR